MRFRRACWGGAVGGALVLAAGCGGPGTPQRDGSAVRGEVRGLSVAVMDLVGVKGKTTEEAPPALPDEGSCDPDDESSTKRQVSQSWSLYGVGDGPLGSAMNRLAAGLPKRGWKVVRNGPDSSAEMNQEIQAVYTATKTQLDVTWERGEPREEPLMIFDVYSVCFHDDTA